MTVKEWRVITEQLHAIMQQRYYVRVHGKYRAAVLSLLSRGLLTIAEDDIQCIVVTSDPFANIQPCWYRTCGKLEGEPQ